jgi:hypothetical protein
MAYGRRLAVTMTMSEVLRDLKTRPTVPIWPYYGRAYSLGRGASYKAAADGLARNDPEFVRSGKSIRLVTAVTRERLGIK